MAKVAYHAPTFLADHRPAFTRDAVPGQTSTPHHTPAAGSDRAARRPAHGDGPPAHRLLVVGESTAAGVGVATHDQGLASQLARHLHQRTGHTIAWHTWGINGITMGSCCAD